MCVLRDRAARVKVLIARPDSNGDVLLAEPAIRAVANKDDVDLLVSEQGRAAAELLPRVKELFVHQLPWIDADPQPVASSAVDALVGDIKARGYQRAIILTSFHQSALPLALILRLAGIPWIAARSEDYPGSLLDLRFRGDDDVHEVERSLQLVQACGYESPRDLRIRINHLGGVQEPARPYVVLHPGGTAPSRMWSATKWRALAEMLNQHFEVLVTGSEQERELTDYVAADLARSLGGKTTLGELASLISGAKALVTGNTSALHLASATHAPVVTLFSPVVPVKRWGPWLTPHLILGNQDAPCANTRVRQCQVTGHPCLDSLSVEEVFESTLYLIGEL